MLAIHFEVACACGCGKLVRADEAIWVGRGRDGEPYYDLHHFDNTHDEQLELPPLCLFARVQLANTTYVMGALDKAEYLAVLDRLYEEAK
jgi:hypothetical protein